MKFKPAYFYGIVFILVAVLLIIFSTDNTTKQRVQTENFQSQNIPDDEIHNPLKAPDSNPSKENVSEEFHRKMADLKQAVDNNPKDTIKLKEYADFLAAAHKTEDAVQMYDRILSIDPQRSDIYFSVTLLYYSINELQKAEEYNEKVLSYDPDNPMALYNKGALAATRGDKETAKMIWEKIIKENPESEEGILAKQSLTRL
jgi:tetratricopeptide (TPR) repeat protein